MKLVTTVLLGQEFMIITLKWRGQIKRIICLWNLIQLIKNELPIYEIISGAALAFAALLLIIPGFVTDIIGFLLIIPYTRNFFIRKISAKLNKKNNVDNMNIIEGDIEEVDKDKNE